jgi:site-specific recombinase XerD
MVEIRARSRSPARVSRGIDSRSFFVSSRLQTGVLPHSLATEMLKRGASLSEIGDLLRHRRPDTTTIYAKVDLVSLRSIALPWPGGNR